MRDGLKLVELGFLDLSLMRSMELNMWESVRASLESPILDLGCGDGVFASLIWSGYAKDIDGVDLDETLFPYARQMSFYRDLRSGDASQRLPFLDNSYASVFCNSVLEHVPNIPGIVKEVRRVLWTGGVFAFTTYSPKLTEFLQGAFGSSDASYMNQQWGHVSLLTVSEWVILLRSLEFEIISVNYYLPRKAVIWLRILTSKVLQAIQVLFPQLTYRTAINRLFDLLAQSLNTSPEESAGYLILARKKGNYLDG
jgi:ubiquinone/menaquinone biosynthesis C-methylase UbiE